ncbi:putative surface protein with fasciclin (FAS1) repeats [Saccharothrix tamanrassetensis]|uniref:Putative surface protein with fasciclin (FAS1) repeats n=1 Tax=Saccharothrix tamanrassetensis TaxID=1051531 RepID=A0A841CBD5_9PSEU|nr:fasciclin domain-containing protein [Saccharothrix tamanrassetensis]MBB5954719.1 putative surface protein with fasciclin (FAS1) repeats [Saccharothrix tamanrassetensis]
MRNSKLALVGAVAAAALSISACGGGDNASSGSTAAEPTTTTPMTTTQAMADGVTKTTDVFGPGCAGVPQDPSDQGSLQGMVDDPVATAASSNPLLTKLVAAVKAAGLVDTLNSQEAITVFAPADPAFAELGDAKFAELANDPATLGKILQFHVVGKRYDAQGLESAGSVKALTGQELKISGSGDAMTVNGAPVLCGNVPTKNATVFVIGKVLTPPAA